MTLLYQKRCEKYILCCQILQKKKKQQMWKKYIFSCQLYTTVFFSNLEKKIYVTMSCIFL